MKQPARTTIAISVVAGLTWGALAWVANATAQDSAKPTLAQAVRAAEQRTNGHARKVEMENENGIDVYEIKTVSKGKSASVLVDLVSGKILRVQGQGFMSGVIEREDLEEDRADLARLEASSMKLAGAIDAAEQETGGRAVEAEMQNRYGSTLFEVHVVKDWVKQKVLIDPATAKVIPVPPETDD